MSAVAWWLTVPVAWSVAMCVREWVHTRQHVRRVVRHQMLIEAHDARIEQALLLDERSQLEDRLHGLMSDALRTALGDDYPDDGLDDLRAAGFNLRPFTDTEITALDGPLYDETAVLMFDAQLYAIDSPDDLGWDKS